MDKKRVKYFFYRPGVYGLVCGLTATIGLGVIALLFQYNRQAIFGLLFAIPISILYMWIEDIIYGDLSGHEAIDSINYASFVTVIVAGSILYLNIFTGLHMYNLEWWIPISCLIPPLFHFGSMINNILKESGE